MDITPSPSTSLLPEFIHPLLLLIRLHSTTCCLFQWSVPKLSIFPKISSLPIAHLPSFLLPHQLRLHVTPLYICDALCLSHKCAPSSSFTPYFAIITSHQVHDNNLHASLASIAQFIFLAGLRFIPPSFLDLIKVSHFS